MSLQILYEIITDATSLLTGLTVINLIVNSLCAVVIVHLLDFRCESDTKTFMLQTLNDALVGFVTGAAIFANMVSKDWFMGHMFCVCNVILNNAIIDLTYVKFYSSRLDKYKEFSKILWVFKTTRMVLFIAWMLTMVYCIAILDRGELGLPSETVGFGAAEAGEHLDKLHGLVIMGDTRAMITVFFPNIVLGFVIIRLHMKAYTNPQGNFGAERVEKNTMLPFTI